MDPLTKQQKAILDVEGQWWPTVGGKESAIRGIGLSPVRYYQLLNRLLESETALLYNAVVVNRLRRLSRRSFP